jgi:hypothetical protein
MSRWRQWVRSHYATLAPLSDDWSEDLYGLLRRRTDFGTVQSGEEKLSVADQFNRGAMASFRFRGAWKALELHGAELISFVTPKILLLV